MSEQTSNLNLPLPLENDNVSRQFFVDLIQKIDNNALSEKQLKEAIAEIAVELTQDYNSTDQDTAISADAVRRGLETKQNTIRLADNYLAASVLVNALPDAQGRAYPDGLSLFKVSSGAGGWPTSNGYVFTTRAGSGGFQMYFEIYNGTMQTDKTSRQWIRSKRDTNAFWQEWTRGLTEVDLSALQTNLTALQTKIDYPRANLVANGTFIYGLVGWAGAPSVAGWIAERSASEAGNEVSYRNATGAGIVFLESLPFPVFAGGTYHVSAEFYAEGSSTSDFWLEFVGLGASGGVFRAVYCVSTDRWTRRGQDVTIPAGVTSAVIRLVIGGTRPANFKGYRRVQVTAGAGAQPYNGLNDGIVSKRVGAFLMEERYIELGLNVPGDGASYIDFHTSSTATDYNARIIAQNGGNANGAQNGRGTITYLAGSGHFFDAPVIVEGVDLKKSVSDGKAAVRAAITGKGGIVADADGDGVPTHEELAAAVNAIPDSKIFTSNYGRSGQVQFGSRYPITTIPPIKKGLIIVTNDGGSTLGSMQYTRLAFFQGSNFVQLNTEAYYDYIYVDVALKKVTTRGNYTGTTHTSLSTFNFDLPFTIEFIGSANQPTSNDNLFGRGIYG